jgi:hypothetical protein
VDPGQPTARLGDLPGLGRLMHLLLGFTAGSLSRTGGEPE